MPQRTYEVEAENTLPEGFWPDEPLQAAGRSELESLMLDAAAVLERIGGVFTIVAKRQEIAPDMFVPVGYVAKWESYAPAQRAPQQAQPAPAVEADQPQDDLPADFADFPVEEVDVEAEAEEDEPEQDPDADDDFGPDAEAALAAQKG